ncbi:MAG: tRNA (N6-threonylcarbamoyladenosine(37)-N6)-methyltransferase TrmO [Planctomycetes bacterium]|nr:tRNA (N6-threonylcarbamoyladenosine(37)-N6)-methyltransferase TrmO [Planctomycetota bacterium]
MPLDLPALPPLQPIGVLRTEQRVHHAAPRQSGLGRGASGTIELRQGLQNALADLGGFSHVWVLFWCHLARGFRSQVVPPRDTKKRGLFATRAPQRPNPIGLSCVRLVRIEKRVLHIADHDLLDGTPVLDLKPYLRYCDAVPDASLGYVAELPEAAADHRAWWQQKGIAPPAVYRRDGERGGPADGAPPDRQLR